MIAGFGSIYACMLRLHGAWGCCVSVNVYTHVRRYVGVCLMRACTHACAYESACVLLVCMYVCMYSGPYMSCTRTDAAICLMSEHMQMWAAGASMRTRRYVAQGFFS